MFKTFTKAYSKRRTSIYLTLNCSIYFKPQMLHAQSEVLCSVVSFVERDNSSLMVLYLSLYFVL